MARTVNSHIWSFEKQKLSETSERIRTVAVILGDNDFLHTFLPLSYMLISALKRRPDLTREKVEKLIKESFPLYYEVY